METRIPEYLQAKLDAPFKPLPPTRDMLARLSRPAVETAFPPLDSMGAPQQVPIRCRTSARAEPPAPAASRPAPRPESQPHDGRTPLRYEFQRQYGELFTNKDCKFVLREEHVADLLQLYNDFNKHRPEDALPMSLSDIVSAALDFVLDHPVSFKGLTEASQARDAIASAVQRRAFARLLPVYESL